MTRPAIVVTGMPRSGAAVVMQMLARGGLPCIGPAPCFEDRRFQFAFCHVPQDVARQAIGKAVKLLWPSMWPTALLPARFVLVTRDPVEQARSIEKFQTHMLGAFAHTVVHHTAADVRAITTTWRDLTRSSRCPFLHLDFAQVLGEPRAVAGRLAALVDAAMDETAMANVVVPRLPDCRPDLSLELSLW